MSKRDSMEKVWIIGEQLGENILNNGFYLWKNSLEENKKAYFVAVKNKKNMWVFDGLSEDEQKFWLWKDSEVHRETYKIADALFVTLSFRDVVPSNVELSSNTKPIIYLQHGILGIKRIGYKPQDYNGNLFRFLYYNKNLREDLIKNNFEEYQLEEVEVPFRFQELVRHAENMEQEKGRCFVFITWRDYGTDENIKLAQKIVADIQLLAKKNVKKQFRVMFHEQFSVKKSSFQDILEANSNLEIISIKEHDIMEEINKSEILITDYSSVVWDATYLGKKVMMYTPDLEKYLENRVLYQKMDNKSYVALSVKDLLDKFKKVSIVEDFNLYAKITKEDVKRGVHTKGFISNIAKQLDVKHTFLGNNFYGVGGTVNATKAHAYHLLRQKKRVELISFTVTTKDHLILPGCQRKIIYIPNKNNKYINLLSKINPRQYFLNNDEYFRENVRFNQYSVLKLIYFLKSNNFDNIISTYETFHHYVNKYANGKKIYMYNTDYEYYEKKFKNKKKIGIVSPNRLYGDKVFVSESLRTTWKKHYDITTNDNLRVVGNQVSPKFDCKINYMEREKNVDIEIRNSFISGAKVGYRGILKFKFDVNEEVLNYNVIIGAKVIPIIINEKNGYYVFEFWCENSMFEDIVFQIELNSMTISKKVVFNKALPSRIENGMRLCYNEVSKSIWWESTEVEYVFTDLDDCMHIKQAEEATYTLIEKQNIEIVEVNANKKIYALKYEEKILDFTHIQSGDEIVFNNEQYTIYNKQFLMKKELKIEVLTYFRISKDRLEYANAVIECGKYFKERQVDIRINVAGRGDLTSYLLLKITEYGLEKYVNYIGFLENPEEEIRKSDFVVSFSNKESFGMSYIETIKNKKPIFTFENLGSRDIFGEESYAIFDTYSELIDKIENFDKSAYDEIIEKVTEKYVVENEANTLF